MTTNTTQTNRLTWQQVMDKYKEGDRFMAWIGHNHIHADMRGHLQFVRTNKAISAGLGYSDEHWELGYKGLFEILEEEPDETQEITKPTPAKEKVQEINIIGVTFHDGKYSLTATYEAHPSGTLITMKGLNDHFLFCKSKGDLATIVVRLMKKATDFIPEATKIMNN